MIMPVRLTGCRECPPWMLVVEELRSSCFLKLKPVKRKILLIVFPSWREHLYSVLFLDNVSCITIIIFHLIPLFLCMQAVIVSTICICSLIHLSHNYLPHAGLLYDSEVQAKQI